MFRFVARAGRASITLPYAARLLAVAAALVILLSLSAGSALASGPVYDANPFRWW